MTTEETFEASGLDYSNEVRVHTSSANTRTHTAPSDVELSTADLVDTFMRTQMLCQLKWEREAEQREKDAAEQAKLLTEVILQNKDMQQREQERAEKYEHEKEDRQAEMKKAGEELAARNERKREEELRIEAVKNTLYRMEKVDRKRSSICQQLQKWDDKTGAEAYLKTFEAAMYEGDFEKADWLPTLRKYLTGRALAVYNEIAPYGDISSAQRLISWSALDWHHNKPVEQSV